jgi:hypothetical protein
MTEGQVEASFCAHGVMACNRSGSNPGRVKDRIGRGLGIELFALNGRLASTTFDTARPWFTDGMFLEGRSE